MRNIFFAIIITTIIFPGCIGLKGEFAFKKFFEDKYRTVTGIPEFEKNEKIKWVYVFKEVKSLQNIIITLYKKELVWVDISNRIENISPANKIIYGSIEEFQDGNYKIVLSSANKVIDEEEFIIFSDHDDYYKYKDE